MRSPQNFSIDAQLLIAKDSFVYQQFPAAATQILQLAIL